MFFVDKLS